MRVSSRGVGSSGEAENFGPRLVDPRQGDVEDDVTSRGHRSLLAIAGTMLVEISLPKLLFAWIISLLLPAVLLGLTPLVATAWLATVSAKIVAMTEVGAALLLIAAAALGWFGWRPLLRIAEDNFWSLNALVVHPGYVFGSELLRHLAEWTFARHATDAGRARLRAASSAAAGAIMCGCAALIIVLVWPTSRWIGTVNDLASLHHLIVPTIANAVILVSSYLAIVSLAWGFADAFMDRLSSLTAFDAASPDCRSWRVAHLSDLHVVGEGYGFRIESGRSGPRGNERLDRVLARLAEIHAADPLDLVLVSGDMTDAGRSAEWAEFLDAIAPYPALAARMIALPGNHDVNIVDRSNPARLDLPFSPGKRLRQMRTLSAIAAVQGDRVLVFDGDGKLRLTLNESLMPYRTQIANFANRGGLRLSVDLGGVFHDQFPMILPPEEADGLAVAILNSNAESHFSFTNALGFISVEQTHRLVDAIDKFPQAMWIIALHHHLLEYPMPVAFSERIGTALVNGSWFVRKLKPVAARAVVMHGHRHIDWIGTCGLLKIISAPSPVMGATNDKPRHFHIHTLVAGADGRICLLSPERVEIAGSGSNALTSA
jgi:3',5'-cyclic AMP phosphodiesterase CpdA